MHKLVPHVLCRVGIKIMSNREQVQGWFPALAAQRGCHRCQAQEVGVGAGKHGQLQAHNCAKALVRDKRLQKSVGRP